MTVINFGGVVKPLLSNKVAYNKRITLAEDDRIVENDKNTASILNEFFSNIIKWNETNHVMKRNRKSQHRWSTDERNHEI